MLIITVPGVEYFDDADQIFITTDDVVLELEHSLVSLSKWESLWEKPFLGKGDKTTDETLSYVRCMCLTPNVPPEVFARLSRQNLQEINDYLNAKMTATWFNEPKGPGKASSEVITAEVIYYWMIAMNIPLECENWHLGRLFTILKVVNLKNSPPKKVGRGESYAQRRALNQARRQQYGTTG